MRPAGLIRFAVVLSLILGSLGAVRAETDGKGVELVSRASRAYEAGAYTDAAASIDAAFKAGLTGEMAARAILLRAQINERSGALARALQDYSNALWMQSLPAPERKTATEGKERVMAAMGLSGSSGSAQGNGQNAAAAPAAAKSSSGGVFGVFDGLFGSSSKPEAVPQTQKPWQATTAPAPAPAPEQPAKKVAVAPAKPAAAPKAAAKPAPVEATVAKHASLQPVSASSVASNSGGFLIVFGSANSQSAGQTRAQQIKTQLADILVSRNLDVEPNPSGGFQIVAGPYKAKSAALALCSAMKQRGVVCQVTP